MPTTASRSSLHALGSLFIAPVVIVVDAGFALVHGLGALAAQVLGAMFAGLRKTGVTPAAAGVEWMRLTSGRARDDRDRALTLIASGWAAAFGGRGPVPPRQLLSRTLLGGTTRLVCVPVFLLVDLGAGLVTTEPSRRWCIAAGRAVSRALHRRLTPGVLPGEVADLAVARTHLGFLTMVWSATPSVMDNNQGILGGCLALLLGDPDWLGDSMRQMREYADYVHEKERNGELGPRSAVPFGPGIVRATGAIVGGYPAETVESIRARGFIEGARAYWRDRDRMHRYLWLFFPFTGHMMMDVRTFLTRGLLDAPQAQRHTLCEWAVVSSALSDEEKDAALSEVQAAAPASIGEFEHYVGLVMPRDGTPAEKAIRRTASGALLDTHTVVPSILDRYAVHVAQSTNAEAYALRTFLWLYRDVARAHDVNTRETARKFGPDVAARISAAPRYPLETWEVTALTAGGPRSEVETIGILLDALRDRGLGDLADRIEAVKSGDVATGVLT
ncbi:MAG: hypothetical protein ABL982_04955 [Vicinamibacterales bacterium]